MSERISRRTVLQSCAGGFIGAATVQILGHPAWGAAPASPKSTGADVVEQPDVSRILFDGKDYFGLARTQGGDISIVRYQQQSDGSLTPAREFSVPVPSDLIITSASARSGSVSLGGIHYVEVAREKIDARRLITDAPVPDMGQFAPAGDSYDAVRISPVSIVGSVSPGASGFAAFQRAQVPGCCCSVVYLEAIPSSIEIRGSAANSESWDVLGAYRADGAPIREYKVGASDLEFRSSHTSGDAGFALFQGPERSLVAALSQSGLELSEGLPLTADEVLIPGPTLRVLSVDTQGHSVEVRSLKGTPLRSSLGLPRDTLSVTVVDGTSGMIAARSARSVSLITL